MSVPGFRPIDPTSAAFLLAENRSQPMHVGGLRTLRAAGGRRSGLRPGDVRVDARHRADRPALPQAPAPLGEDRRHAGVARRRAVRHRAPRPAQRAAAAGPGPRVCWSLVGRLHSTRLAWERPLWETHVIEGLADGRVAMYTKLHHSLVDGISAMRLMASVLSSDPERRNMPAPFAEGAARRRRTEEPAADSLPAAAVDAATTAARTLADLPADALRGALSISAEAAGMPLALVKTLRKGIRNETSAVSLSAPRTIFNQSITGARRFAAQDWPVERLRGVGKATGTTINDVVLAMCSGAMRTYLAESGRAAREVPRLDGPGRPQRQAGRYRLGRGRQRDRRGDGPSRHRPGRPRRAAAHDQPVDEGRQGGAVLDDADPDRRDERHRDGALDRRTGAGDAGHGAPSVQPDHQQRARAPGAALLERRAGSSATTPSPSRSTARHSTSPARRTPATWASG
ncbi:wax ester/triacylglycerol synthase domain-containing protein [Nocardioides convexus]|uniref:wax ester/triacylglycerol synthase domain-containing protein n=1 Tax=Nocardioides convexus TaxID=2712224 RepID=UPI0024182E2E|nr:wax ester/triacylglycerol synthase domain-containing protein [Nocardioides convexus]